ncbi:MAG: T9SS type A sorting domain-containing protein [Flavobacteriaceae bacterium]
MISPNNPYTKEFVKQNFSAKGTQPQQQSQNIEAVKLKDITKAFDSYWEGKDYRQKGSGYKPFKRWAEHWSHYLRSDGTIAPPSELWNAWEQKVQNEALTANNGVPTANWTNLGPAVVSNSSVSISGQGRINAIAKDPSNPNTIYIGAPAGGIWRSTDDGANWTPLSDYLPQIGVSGIAVDPNNPEIIYISTGDDDAGDSYSIGVMKTLDGGQTWNVTGLQFNNVYKGSSEIFIDPTDSNTVWVATSQGLHKTIDGGDIWFNVLPGNIVDFRFQPGNSNTLYAVGYDNNNTSKFFKTTDGGVSFTEIDTIPDNADRIILEVTPANPNVVYVLTAASNYNFQGVYKSTDGGESFAKTAENDDIFQSSQAWYDMALTVSDVDPNIVFVGVLDIWKSTDGGDNFSQLNYWYNRTAAFTHADIHFMRYFDGVLYAGTDGGIYRSSNNGDAFEDLSNTLSIAQIYTVSTSRPNSGKLASGLQDCGGFALSGTQWNSYHGGDGMGTAVDPFQEDWYYGMTQYGGNLYRTRVGGSGGWSNREYITSGPTQGNWVTPMQFNKNGELYAGYDQLYVLQSGSWQKVSNHNFGENLRQIELDPNNSNTIYVSTNYNVYKSTNKGQTFSLIYSSASGYVIRSIEVHHTNSDIVWILESDGFAKSTDGGASFTDLSAGMPGEFKRVLKHQPYSDHDALYLGTTLGVYYYDNEVGSWTSISQGLPNVEVSDIEININDHTLTASTYGRGIWQTPIPQVSVPEIDIDLLSVNLGTSDYKCDNSISPYLRVYNNGNQNISSFTVETRLNDNTPTNQNWSGLLAPGEWTQVNLTELSGLQNNVNSLRTTLVLFGDEQTNNNILEVDFEYTPDASNQSSTTNTLFSYEAAEDNWLIVGDSVWEKGIPEGSNLNQTASGSMAYATNLNGNYPDQSNSELVSPCFDLSLISDPVAKFYMAYDIEYGWDYLFFQYAIDGGNQWTTLAQYTGLDDTPTDWSLNEYSFDLSAISDETNVIFRFKMVTDTYVNNEGAVIDDFVITGTTLSNGNDVNTNRIQYYPNPTTGNLSLYLPNPVNDLQIAVRDIRGSLVFRPQTDVVQHRNINLDLSDLANGVYFIEISSRKVRQTLKVVKD